MSESGVPAGCERDSPPGRWLARLHPDGPHTVVSDGVWMELQKSQHGRVAGGDATVRE